MPALTLVIVGAVGVVAAVTDVEADDKNGVQVPPPTLHPSRPASEPDIGVAVTRISCDCPPVSPDNTVDSVPAAICRVV